MSPFDEGLFSLKLGESTNRMQRETMAGRRKVHAEQLKIGQGIGPGYFAKLIDSDIEIVREHLKDVDKACRETWLADGNDVTPEFLRTVLIPHLFTAIASRKGAIGGDLELLSGRTRSGTCLTPARHHLAREIGHLQNEIATRYEIEAIEIAKHESRRLGARSVPGVSVAPLLGESMNTEKRIDGESKSQTGGVTNASVTEADMFDHNVEINLQTQIEVLERRISACVDKSSPEFRRMVEQKQVRQRDLDTLREARRLRHEKKAIEAPVATKGPHIGPANQRDLLIRPMLLEKGWSIHDWATTAAVDFHTADNYLKGKTKKPYPTTLRKLALALGVKVDSLPA